MADLKTVFGIIETVLGTVILMVSIGGFYFVFTYNTSTLSFPVVNPADPTSVIVTLVSTLVTLLKTILYSFNFMFLFTSILLILDGILKIKDED